jgi:hypothetical protein
MAIPLLIPFTESLDVRFAVRIEEFLAVLLPRRFEFGRCDVPVRPAFLANGTYVLAEIFQSGPAEEPVAVVDLIYDKTGLEDNRVGIMGLLTGLVHSAMSRSFWTIRPASERRGQWAPTPLRYSFVSVILSVLIVTSRQ